MNTFHEFRSALDSVDAETNFAAPLTDTGNAEVFIAAYGDLVRYDHRRKRWLRWGLHRWEPDMDAAVRRMAIASIRERRKWVLAELDSLSTADSDVDAEMAKTRKRLWSILRWLLRSESRPAIDHLLTVASWLEPVADDGTGWDETPGIICCENGIVDLRTGELRPGRPEDKVTKQIPILYDPAARAARFAKALREWLDTGDDLETERVVTRLRRLMGYGLTGEASLELLLFLMGVGSNGKSTFLEVYRAACGDYAMEVEATVLKRTKHDRHSTEVADLSGARMVTCEELGDEKLNTDRIKHLTGGTHVRARRIRENAIEFRQTWLMWLTSNGQPRADDSSWGFWRRIEVYDFPHTFEPDERLKGELLEELPGVLAGIVRGAVEWYAEGLGEVPVSVAEHTKEYRESVDPLEALFGSESLVEEPGTFSETETLYRTYQWYMRGLGQTYTYGLDGFAKALAGRPGIKRHRPRVAGTKVRGFLGVKVGDLVPPEVLEGGPQGQENGSEDVKTLLENASEA